MDIKRSLDNGIILTVTVGFLTLLGYCYSAGYLTFWRLNARFLDWDNGTFLYNSIQVVFLPLAIAAIVWYIFPIFSPFARKFLESREKSDYTHNQITCLSLWLILISLMAYAIHEGQSDALKKSNSPNNCAVVFKGQGKTPKNFILIGTNHDNYFLYEKDSFSTRIIKKDDVQEITLLDANHVF